MAHHSSEPLDKSVLAQLFAGPTGKFPQGKLTETDEGELAIAIGTKDGKVILDFGTPTAWIGFDAEQAEQIARSLLEHAVALKQEQLR